MVGCVNGISNLIRIHMNMIVEECLDPELGRVVTGKGCAKSILIPHCTASDVFCNAWVLSCRGMVQLQICGR